MSALRSGLVLASRYTLDRRLGGVGATETWLARDKMTRADVALKILAGDGFSEALLQREWEVTLRLVHPNIARAFEFQSADPAFYSMQLVDGPDLSVLTGAALADTLPVIASIADALRYAHGRGVVHRDIKASNILLDPNGAPYLIDFGVAADDGGDVGGGSLIASSPQRLDGQDATPADDVFALGGLMYELLTGQSPYSAAHVADDIRSKIPDVAVAASGEAIPDDVSAMLASMLSKAAEERPDAETIVDRLSEAGYQKGTAPRALVGKARATRVEVASIAPRRSSDTPPQPAAATATRRGGLQFPIVAGAFAVLVALLLSVLFLLPRTVEQSDDIIETPIEASTQETVPETETREPPQRDERVIGRQETERVLGQLLAKIETLDARAAPRWGGLPYQQARAVYAAGDEAYLDRNYAVAIDSYRQAIDLLDPLLVQADEVFEKALMDGQDAIDAAMASDAIEAFELAVAVTPNSALAVDGLTRARNLDEVLALVDQGVSYERDLELEAARQSFAGAVELDPAWQPAQDGLRRVEASIRQFSFESRMSEGLAALAQQDYLSARAAFRMADEIRPGAPEPADGLQQVDQALRLESIRSLERKAIQQKQTEQWEMAVETYEDILELDANLSFAQDGLSESRSMVTLFETIEGYIDDPDSLVSPGRLQQATQTLIGMTRIAEMGPRLTEQRDELSRLLKRASTPLSVQMVSDNATNVSVFKVGRLGTFATRQLELKPGTYVAVGNRAGYRDVRVEFRVAPEIDMQPVVVRCEEPI
ncbi:MAG: serine/threonine-protein kinase [Pseudomonadota bacterium]